MTPVIDMVALSKALRQLHHEVLEVGLRGHAAAHGRIEDPFARLALVREDPSFESIKPLTSALVDLDEALDAEDAALRAPAVLDRIQGLLTGKGRRSWRGIAIVSRPQPRSPSLTGTCEPSSGNRWAPPSGHGPGRVVRGGLTPGGGVGGDLRFGDANADAKLKTAAPG